MMRKVLFFVLLSCFYFGQDKRIDSLRNELKKKPNNFFLQVDIIGALTNINEVQLLKKELQIAQIRFKNNEDHRNYFKINTTVLLLNEQKNIEANQKLDEYATRLDLENLPQSNMLFNYLKAVTESRLGKHKIAEKHFEKTFKIIKENKSDKNRFGYILNSYAASLTKLGNYEKALSIYFEILKIKNYKDLANVYTNIGICYYHLKQFKKAEHYYKLGVEHSDIIEKANNTSNLAILYLDNNEVEKAEKTMAKLDLNKLSNTDSAAVFSVLADIEKQKKNYKKALEYFKIVEKIDFENNQNSYLINDYLAIGILYMESKDYNQAENYLKKSYHLLEKHEENNAKMEVLQNLLELDFLKNNNLTSKKHFEEFITLSDSINSNTVQESTNALNIKYQTELKEAQIKSQQLELEKEKTNRNIAISVIGFLLLISGSGFLFFKNRQKQKELQNQNTLLGLQQNLNAMELQSLNKQLDPHEIKNLLASISPEIQEKAPDSYKKMLKLFNITKASLNNNSLTESIENQTQQIEDFLSLEKNMLADNFEYSIENKIENKNLQIPRLMLKNLVENAIKHGIKGNGGVINVLVTEKNNFITIIVDDSGKGRKQAISLDSGIGTSTYQKLFATLNQKNKDSATFEIIDKEQGTKVEVRIPKDYKYS